MYADGELAALGLGSHFERVKVAWNRYIDSLSKASVRDAQVVFMLRSQSPDEAASARMVHDSQGDGIAQNSGTAQVLA